jgi:hypothetical protein
MEKAFYLFIFISNSTNIIRIFSKERKKKRIIFFVCVCVFCLVLVVYIYSVYILERAMVLTASRNIHLLESM